MGIVISDMLTDSVTIIENNDGFLNTITITYQNYWVLPKARLKYRSLR